MLTVRRVLLAAVALAALPVVPAVAGGGCAGSSGVTLLTPKGLTTTMATPGTPVAGSAAGSDTKATYRLDLTSVKRATAAPVRVTVSWGTPASDFDIAVGDRFGVEHGRGTAVGTTSETVTTEAIGACEDLVVTAKNKAGSPADALKVALSVGTPVTGAPPRTSALKRSGWTALALPGPGDTGNTGPGDPVENAFDGRLSTRWSSRLMQNPAEFFQLDTGKATAFTRLSMVTGPSPGDQPVEFTVAVSDDTVTWRQVGAGAGRAVTDVRFAEQTARYVKVGLTGATFPNWWSIAELDLYRECFSKTAC